MQEARILIVEDDKSLREDLAMALEMEGYWVRACALGLEAIELAGQHEFDLVVSDIRMAGMDGLETVERLQASQPSVATLVITGYTDEADSIRAVRLGVGDYLKKPFRLDEFLAAVERQLRLHRARRLRAAREQNFARAALWTLEGWLGELGQDERLLAGRRARLLAEQMGAGAEAPLVLLLDGLRQARPALDLGGLPSDFLAILGELSGEDQGLAARVAQMALAPEAPDPASPLAAAWAQREAPVVESRRRRAQLLLARSQEQAGQGAEAVASYRVLLEDPALEDREQVEAWLGLMRLEGGACRQHALQALQLASRQPPLIWAVASLEAGLYLAQNGAREESAGCFERAAGLAGQLGQPLLQARAQLAQLAGGAPLEPELILQRLLDPADRFELMDSAWWMVPLLLRRQAAGPTLLQERLLKVMARDVPGVFLRLVQAGRLDAGARQAMAAALAGHSHPGAQQALRLLASDGEAEVRRAAEAALQTGVSKPVPPTLRIYTLGGFEVWRGEERVPDNQFRSAKQRFLLARLAGSPRPLAAERLIDEFWPDDAEGGRASLNVSISHMRKLLRPAQWQEELDYVPRTAAGLELQRELPVWHDYEEFEKAAESDTLSGWQQAVDLYRGPYLESCYLEWAETRRGRAELLVGQALQRIVQALLDRKRPQELLLYAGRLAELDLCSLEAHQAVMQAQLELARPEAALRQFEVYRRNLERELGLEPPISMLELRQRAILFTDRS